MNDYCKYIFQKDLYSLTEQDIINFFLDEKEETSILEFKSGDVGIENICKEVCAFLNTEGGLL